jgi:hypothetical protein
MEVKLHSFQISSLDLRGELQAAAALLLRKYLPIPICYVCPKTGLNPVETRKYCLCVEYNPGLPVDSHFRRIVGISLSPGNG